MKFLLPIIALLVLSSCASVNSTLERWSSENNSNRKYEVKTAWVRQTTEKDNLGFRKINRMTPVLVGDYIIQANGMDGVVAYEKVSGREAWRLPIANGAEPSAAAIKDRIFIGASDGNFYSIEASTGIVQWTFPTKSENLAAPIIADGIVYFMTSNNVFYALDASTGTQVWLYSRQDTSAFSIRGGSQAALNDGKLYVGFSDGSLVSLDAKSGSVLWETQLNRNKRFRDIDATPVVSGSYVYVAGYDDKLYCVSKDKGELLWKVEDGGYSAVTIIGDKLVYPTTNSEVLALNKETGNKIWSYKLKQGIATQVISYKGSVVFGESQGHLRFLDPNSGKELNSFEPGRGILSAPLVDEKNNRVYFISGEANLFAIDAGWIRKPYF